MKKILIVSLCACLGILVACAQNDDRTVITGKLAGLADGTVVGLIPGATHKNEAALTEATVTNGEFVLEQAIEEPMLFYVSVMGTRAGFSVLAGPGDKIVLEGTLENPVVKGSELNDEYIRKYVEPRGAMNKMFEENHAKYADLSRRMGEVRQAGDEDAQAAIRAGDEWKAYEQSEADFFRSMGELFDRAVAENTGTFWGPLLMLSHTSYLTPENEKHYNMLSEEAKNSYYGKLVAEEIFGKTGTAPVFTAKDAEGNEHSLTDLLTGDNYILVDFWASWCQPCRRFVPTLKQLAAKYADKGLTVVSISTDTDREAWLGALEEEQMPWLNLQDSGSIADDYGVTGIPSLFLIDPRGEIVFGKQSGQSVVDKLGEVFGN